MPRVNHTIDDRSPLIQYNPSGSWRLGSRTSDPLGMRYDNNGTFTLTTDNGAAATFTFNGTGIWILGAKRSNHGPYEVNLDNAVQQLDGFSSDSLFQFPLFAAENLANGLHTVTIVNRPRNSSFPFLDIDSIVWETEVNDINPPQRILPHTDSSFKFEPSTAWDTPVSAGFNSTTAHSTTISNATAQLNFTGSAVTIFGAINTNAGPYSVQLDSRPPQTFNASVAEYVPQTVLYFADNLGPGVHVVEFVNLPDQAGQSLSLDYALVTGGKHVIIRDSGSNGLGSGAIAGIAVGAVALLALIPLIFFWRRKRRADSRSDVNLIGEDKESYNHTHREIPPEGAVTPFTAMSMPSSSVQLPQPGTSAVGARDSESTSFYQGTETSSSPGVNPNAVLYAASRGRSDSDSRTDSSMPQPHHRPTPSASTTTTAFAYPREKGGTTIVMSPLRSPPPPQPSYASYTPVAPGNDVEDIDGDGEVETDAPPSYSHAAAQR